MQVVAVTEKRNVVLVEPALNHFCSSESGNFNAELIFFFDVRYNKVYVNIQSSFGLYFCYAFVNQILGRFLMQLAEKLITRAGVFIFIIVFR